MTTTIEGHKLIMKNSVKPSESPKASTQNSLTESSLFVVRQKHYVKNNALKESINTGGTLRKMSILALKDLLDTLRSATLQTQTELARRTG